MKTYTVETEVLSDHIFRASAGERQVIMDTGSGQDKGQSPIELVLSAISGCAVVDVLEILTKRRKTIESLKVDVEAERRDEPHPRIFTRIVLTFKLVSPDANHEELAKAIDLSLNKYCSVRGMIGPDVQVIARGEITRSSPVSG